MAYDEDVHEFATRYPAEFLTLLGLRPRGPYRAESIEVKKTELPGWVVVPFQPPQGFDCKDRVWGHDVELDPRAMRFDPTTRHGDPTALGLRVVARPHPGLSLDDLRVAVHRILATGLGDEAFARIDHVDVAGADPVPDELIPLPDLPRYVAWHERRTRDR